MNSAINRNQTIDTNCISQINEMMEKGLDKLKSFTIFKTTTNLEFYWDISKQFNEIALKLRQLKLWDELKYFNSISLQIEYIVYQNSLDSSFGHCSFAVETLKCYIEFIKTNFDFYLNSNNMTSDEFEAYQIKFKRKHGIYRREFYRDIYRLSGDYTEDELYEIHESIRQ